MCPAKNIRDLSEQRREYQDMPLDENAWVSQQSSVITSRSLLEMQFAKLQQKFAAGNVPIPSFWGGCRVVPQRFEFWQGGLNRLHDRFEYVRQKDDSWDRHRLAP